MKNEGPIHFRGSHQDLVFYYLNGKPVVRRKSYVPKRKLKQHPSFFGLRRQSTEFKRVQQLGRKIRFILVPFKKKCRDIAGDNNLTRMLGRIKDQGAEGIDRVREFNFTQFGRMLEGFEFHSEYSVKSMLYGRRNVSCNSVRNNVTIEFPSFHGLRDVKPPAGAAFIHLRLSIGVLHNCKYDGNQYTDGQPGLYPINAHVNSGWIPLKDAVQPLQLTVTLPGAPELASDETLIASLAVEFVGEGHSLIETHRGCVVVGVW